MTAAQLTETLSASGIRLSATDGKLRVDAPAGVMTAEIKAELTMHKPELLALLAQRFCQCRNAPMQRIEAGYFACDCGYQIVDPCSHWVTSAKRSSRFYKKQKSNFLFLLEQRK